MRIFFLLISILPFKSNAQFDFENNTTNKPISYIPYPNFDSVKFEFRMWEDAWLYPSFYQMTYDTHGKWNYRRGIIYDEGVYELDLILPTPNIDSIWNILISKNVLKLESQNEVRASIKMGDIIHKLDVENFEKLLGTDGTAYTIELMSKDTYRCYSYINPISLSKGFKKSDQNWIATEHHLMADIVNTLNDAFNRSEINTILVEKWKEKHQSNDKKR